MVIEYVFLMVILGIRLYESRLQGKPAKKRKKVCQVFIVSSVLLNEDKKESES